MTRTITLTMGEGRTLTISGDERSLVEALGLLIKGADAGHMPVAMQQIYDPPMPERLRRNAAAKGTREAQVIAALRAGEHTPDAIAKACGCTNNNASVVLGGLVAKRLVKRVGYGRYALAEAK